MSGMRNVGRSAPAKIDERSTKPEEVSPGCEAYWSRRNEREWVAVYGSRELLISRASPRSPMLNAYIDGRKVFGRVRFLPVAQQRCEAIVRLDVGASER